jgi:excisionase family DNA binding protein
MESMEPTTPTARPLGAHLTVSEAAKRLHIHRRTAYRFIKEGRLPAVVIGSAIRVPEEALMKMLDESSIGVTR